MNKSKITWGICQEISDYILLDGINELKKSNKLYSVNDVGSKPGNYFISHDGKSYYIGEAKNINKRLKQQINPKRSTFYKNYLKIPYIDTLLEINDFNIQVLIHSIGRKEIEEFAIVNLGTILNKFQKGKRKRISGNPNKGIWDEVQINADIILSEGENELLNVNPVDWYSADVAINAGIYYVENNVDGLIYIGESSNINQRYNTHSKDTYFSALRRHIGTDILGFELKERNKRKRYFSESENKQINSYLDNCLLRTMKINFGRFELEEFLIRKHKPLLNRKENK
jgi:predicted GIY-YIG superfamily endonuclease